MAVTFTFTEAVSGKQNMGSLFARIGTLNLSGTASAGGDTITAALVGLSRILHVNTEGCTAEGFVPAISYSGVNAVLKLFQQTGTAAALVVATGATVTGSMPVIIYGL